ncbi:MAG: cell wall hydrolase [Parvularculaceae bacterium]
MTARQQIVTKQHHGIAPYSPTAKAVTWRVCWQSRKIFAGALVVAAVFLTILSGQRFQQAQAAAAVSAADSAEIEGLFVDYLAFLEEEQHAVATRPIEASLDDLDPLDPTLLKVAAVRGKEQQCLAEAIYYEARNEAAIGRVAVADVILNRVKSSTYPDTVCGVVYQGSTRKTGCQFSFTCDGSKDRPLEVTHWDRADNMATAIMAGIHMPVSRNATHYHANYVSPYWAPNLQPTATIGTHKFYKFPSRQWMAAAAQ